MARTPAQRGPFGRWLTRVRTERYERQVDALADMKRLAGLSISQAEFSQWESGSRVPRPDNPKVERLYEFFGSRPEEENAPAPEGEGLAAAISALVVELQAMRQERESIALRLETLEAAVALLARPSGEGLSALGPPPVEAGSGR